MKFINCAAKVADKISTCVDIAILASPLIVGVAFYGTIIAAEIGLKTAKVVVWGKDE